MVLMKGLDDDDPFASVIVSAPTLQVAPPANRGDLTNELAKGSFSLLPGKVSSSSQAGAARKLSGRRSSFVHKRGAEAIPANDDDDDDDPFSVLDRVPQGPTHHPPLPQINSNDDGRSSFVHKRGAEAIPANDDDDDDPFSVLDPPQAALMKSSSRKYERRDVVDDLSGVISCSSSSSFSSSTSSSSSRNTTSTSCSSSLDESKLSPDEVVQLRHYRRIKRDIDAFLAPDRQTNNT